MRNIFAAAAVIAFCVVAARGQAPPRYIAVEIGNFAAQSPTWAWDINNLGQVTGSVGPPNPLPLAGVGFAFRIAPNGPIDLATTLIDRRTGVEGYSVGNGINDLGQVVGAGYFDGSDYLAFRTRPNEPLDLARDGLGELEVNPPGGTVAFAVNAHGQAVGYSGFHAFRTAPNARINPATDDLGALANSRSMAYDINSSGVVVGESAVLSGDFHAFRSPPNGVVGPLTDLGTLGGRISQAKAINDEGWIVGFAELPDLNFHYHAFRVAPGGVIDASSDLGTLGGPSSYAWDINNPGWTVGESWVDEQTSHAFLHDGQRLWDLNDLIPQNSPWELLSAVAINDRGQIIATAQREGVYDYVRLDPVPEPAGMVLCAGTIILLTRRRSKRAQREGAFGVRIMAVGAIGR